MMRKQERVPFFTEVTLEFASGRREARISDLGEGGCYVECVATVRPGETVRLELRMPDGRMVPAAGEVKYVFNGMGFGMKFVDVSEELRSLVDELLAAAPAER